LELTDEQVAVIKPGYDEYISSAKALKSDNTLTNEEKKAASASLREVYDIELRNHLTEAQKEKLDQYGSRINASRSNKK
jgi:purine nucleoside phosphorylase